MKDLICLPILMVFMACGGGSPGPKTDVTGYMREGLGHGGEVVGYVAADDTWLAKGTLVDEVRNGTWITYHAGKDMPKTITTFVHGKKNGVEMEFNDRGQMVRFSEFKNDQLHGMNATYQFGRMLEQTHYKEGQMDGPFAIYTSRGVLQRKGGFKNGKQHGTLQYFDEEGNVTLQYEYENGEKVSGGMVDPAIPDDDTN